LESNSDSTIKPKEKKFIRLVSIFYLYFSGTEKERDEIKELLLCQPIFVSFSMQKTKT
jgi:hypothetical protein